MIKIFFKLEDNKGISHEYSIQNPNFKERTMIQDLILNYKDNIIEKTIDFALSHLINPVNDASLPLNTKTIDQYFLRYSDEISCLCLLLTNPDIQISLQMEEFLAKVEDEQIENFKKKFLHNQIQKIQIIKIQ